MTKPSEFLTTIRKLVVLCILSSWLTIAEKFKKKTEIEMTTWILLLENKAEKYENNCINEYYCRVSNRPQKTWKEG